MEKEEKIANIIANYSIEAKGGENVLITADTFDALPLINKLIDRLYDNSANVSVRFYEPTIDAKLLENVSLEKIKLIGNELKEDIKNYDAFVHINCNVNDYEEAKINYDVYKKIDELVDKYKIKQQSKKRWLIVSYPTIMDAYKANMGFNDYKDFSFDVMMMDYQKLINNMEYLKALMEKTDKIRITGSGTDLTISIKDCPIMTGVGIRSIPDGDIYSLGVGDYINGTIKFNTIFSYMGFVFKNVVMSFQDGHIISATCDNGSSANRLNQILENNGKTIGAFTIGLNKKIDKIMNNNLYDSKMLGSISLSFGNPNKAKEMLFNMTLVLTKEYGGGNVYFDEKLVMKDGKFVISELSNLNKDN